MRRSKQGRKAGSNGDSRVYYTKHVGELDDITDWFAMSMVPLARIKFWTLPAEARHVVLEHHIDDFAKDGVKETKRAIYSVILDGIVDGLGDARGKIELVTCTRDDKVLVKTYVRVSSCIIAGVQADMSLCLLVCFNKEAVFDTKTISKMCLEFCHKGWLPEEDLKGGHIDHSLWKCVTPRLGLEDFITEYQLW